MRRYFITLILLVLGTLMGQAQYSVLNGDLDHDGRITQKDVEVMADIILEKASVETIKSTSAMSYDVVRPDDCAELLDGSSFNTAIKKVANPSQQYFVDTTIRKITFRKDSSDEGTIVSSPSSPRVARALYNASAREVVVYVGADYLAFPESCAGMFEYLQSLTEIDWSAFGANIFTHNVKSMNSMFSGCLALTKLDVSHFDTRKVTNMGEMFSGCSKLSSLKLGSTFAPQGTMTSILLNTPDPAGSTKCTITCTAATKAKLCLDEGTNESKIIWNIVVEAPAKSTTLMRGENFRVAIMKLVNPSAEDWDIDTTIRKITFRMDGSTIGTVVSSNESLGTARAVYNAETKEVVIYVNADKLIFPSDCENMFYNLRSLEQIDWSAFGQNIDTRNVTSMLWMFSDCVALTTLDVSNFNTGNVTNMAGMFSSCLALTTLDVSHFDTRNVTKMNDMFSYCVALTKLDVSHFDTRNVTDMIYMFRDCSKLSSLNLGSGFTIHGTCDAILLNTPDPAGSIKCTITCTAAAKTALCHDQGTNESKIIWNIIGEAPDEGEGGSEDEGESVKLLSGTSFNTAIKQLVNPSATNWDLDTTIRKITFRKGDSAEGTLVSSSASQGKARAVYDAETHEVMIYVNAEKLIFPSDCQGMFAILMALEQIDWSAFGTNIDTGNVTNMSLMFDHCSALTTLDVTHFDTGNVGNMGNMFSGCSALTTLDVSHFDTGNVRNIDSMFDGCSALTTLDVSHFDTSNVTVILYMFRDCSKLSSLNLGSTFKIHDKSKILLNTPDPAGSTKCTITCTAAVKAALCLDEGTNESKIIWNIVGDAPTEGEGGSEDEGESVELLPGLDFNTSIKQLVNPSATHNSIDTTIRKITFRKGYSAEGTVVSSSASQGKARAVYDAETHEVMIYVNAEKLIFPSSCRWMFGDLEALEQIDWSAFGSNIDTSKVTDISYMFKGCLNITALDLSQFNTSKVEEMISMFRYCSKLSSLNLGSDFVIDDGCHVSYMFEGTPNATRCTITCTEATKAKLCSSVTMIEESKINWNILGGASFVSATLLSGQSFNERIKKLVNPSATNWNEDTTIRKITFIIGKSDEGTLVSSSASLGTARAIYDAETQQVVIYADGEKLIFPSNCQSMFADLKALEQIDWSAFGTNIDTGNVTNMSYMFAGCSALTTLDLTSFNTSKVTKMADMFAGCSALTTLDLTSFDTSKVTTMANMFQRCSALTALDLTSFDTSMVTTMGNMFFGCSQLSSLDLGSGFVIDMSCNIAYILNGTPDPAGTTQCTITCTKTTWYRLRESGTGIDQSKIKWIEC